MEDDKTSLFSPEIEALLSALNDRQRRFVLSYVVHLNATKAAADAGYSDNSLRQIGSQNLSKLDIANAIGAILSEQAMGVAEALRRMTDWARGTMSHFVETAEEVVTNPLTGEPIMNSDGKPVTTVRARINLGSESAQANMHLIKKISSGAYGLGIELHDAKDATAKLLEAQGKLPGAGAGTNVTIIQIPDNGR